MKLKGWLVFGFLIIFLVSEAGALGVRCQILDPNTLKNHTASTALPSGATTGYVLQFVSGGVSSSPTTVSASDYLATGTTQIQQTRVGYNMDAPSAFNLGDGRFKTQFGEFGGSIGVRAWEGTSISTVIAAQGWYGNSANQGVSSAGDVSTLFWDVPTSFTWYRAAPPPAPSVTAGSYNLTYSAPTYNVQFTLTAVAGSGDPVQVTQNKIRVKKQGAAVWWGENIGSSWTITDNPSSQYFFAGSWYIAQAQATSNFGVSEWGVEKLFQIPAAGTGEGGAATFNYKLYGIDPAKLVINSISIPAKTTTAGSVGSAKELAAVINLSAGEKIVAAISKWDPATGVSKTAGFDLTSGDLLTGTEDFTFEPGEGVQVYTTKTLENFSLVGQ